MNWPSFVFLFMFLKKTTIDDWKRAHGQRVKCSVAEDACTRLRARLTNT